MAWTRRQVLGTTAVVVGGMLAAKAGFDADPDTPAEQTDQPDQSGEQD